VSSDGCELPLQTQTVLTDSCLYDGVVSFKFQLAMKGRRIDLIDLSQGAERVVHVIHVDTCQSATVHYFHDDECTVYAGSSNIKTQTLGCRRLPSTNYFTTVYCTSPSPDSVPADQDDT
jgi:hypothetical protein